MKSIFCLIIFHLNTIGLLAQPPEEIKRPLAFFPNQRAKVLIAGSFHFDYPNKDMAKVQKSDQIDVLTEPKKSEVTELVNYIKKFKPTKIAIEAFPEWEATRKLKKYKKGEFSDKRDERYQLAMRIAKELNLDTLYSIDCESFDKDLMKVDSTYFQAFFEDYNLKTNDEFIAMYQNWYTYDDKLAAKTNLLTYFKYMNSEEVHKLGFGSYLIGNFKLEDHRGADILSIWWYNRNLRIFRKLQQITESNEDRILVIFGNGHASVLRQLVESSPAYEFVEFGKL
ncbi:DUF5694 domain-containing protein [Dyadobacter pollutisoli]|uniref:DUF5694 domain-containing protein n=1 Tax=Dyadobacter pollutisoli TaxID=2910158 RepID=A0A9E8NGJ6_9BACT|nr:DUF5694 domain-containing protein [Dyadobacter pollutisoli]WAC14908.1 DUF5694 domain-containing protein [Dyadobacter pollutisoli]